MPDLWLPGATRVPGNNGLRAGAGGGKGLRFFTHHSFEAGYTYSPDGIAAMRYLHSRASTSHFVFHPVTGAIVQGLPADQAARTLAAQVGYPYDVNRFGDVHMQVEVIAYARRPWTLDLTRAGLDGLTRLMNFLRAWGIPDQWAWADVVRPPATYGEANAPGHRRMPDRSGHAFHSKWPVPPGIDGHWDPGAIDPPWTLVGTTRPSPTPPPRKPAWPAGWIADRQRELAALGYYTGAIDDSLGEQTEGATRAYQTDRGDLVVDGQPGQATADALGADMATIDDVLREVTSVTLSPADYRTIYGREVDGPQVVRQDDADRLTWRRVYDTLRHTRSIEATLAAQGKVLEQLAAGQGIDPTVVREAVAASVREGLDDVAAEVRDALLAEGVADSVAARVVARVGSLLTATTEEN